MSGRSAVLAVVVAVVALWCTGSAAQEKQSVFLTRVKTDNLSAAHEAVLALRAAVKPVPVETGYQDFRAVMHAHSRLSHDSRGTPEEILAAAQRTKTRVVMMTEHPDPKFDWFKEGLSGLRDGVLFVPGAETSGLLIFPKESLAGQSWQGPAELAELVQKGGGLAFMCHTEEWAGREAPPLTGMEIYNLHSDFLQQPHAMGHFEGALKDVSALMGLVAAVQKYPEEFLGALETHPEAFLKRWDETNQKHRITGIAANDTHNNFGLIAKVADEGTVTIDDPLGERLGEVTVKQVPALAMFIKDKKPGETLLELRVDPYGVSFGYVGTHLLMKELSREQVWEALTKGRCYVAFDWMADASGFAFIAADGEKTVVMGEEIGARNQPKLTVAAPLAGEIRVLRNGEMIAKQADTNQLGLLADKPGVYRAEVWLSPAGDARPWIISGPIIVN